MLRTMTKVCIFSKSNDVTRFDIFKKFFECQHEDIPDVLHRNRCSLSKCASLREERNPSQSYRESPAIWDHTVCRPTQVSMPRLNPSHAGRYSVYLPQRDGRL